ncbi:quinone-dependent dihydroorotate dehydrogenase [Auraticoccus cholistanensis]|uniref:quinone-dependent dihydroorotate dehydrogenase n=1 Tax=Auraticoccus cholistanensis TaxID=2656650 RepID=UPI002F91AFDE
MARLRPAVLSTGYRRLLRPALFAAAGGDPEAVHEATLERLEQLGRHPHLVRALRRLTAVDGAEVELAGIRFPGPVGLAAGMDKGARAVTAWQGLGFSHVEVGTVTAHPQPGNPRPRVFRAPLSGGLVNRMGFNNDGAAAVADRLARAGVRRGNGAAGVPVGISLGKSKVTPLPEAVEDYLTSLRLLAPHADYLAVNVSSPNTPGLRRLQDGGHLRELVTALVAETRTLAGDAAAPVPVLVKLAPDLGDEALDEVLEVCEDAGAAGIIATNTTTSRDGLVGLDQRLVDEPGGLSGAPLRDRARAVVARVSSRSALPVIGVGGIMTADDALALLDAGARLVQVYTGFIYAGPGLVAEITARHARRQAPAGTPSLGRRA